MFAKRITKEEINDLPLLKYEGKIVVAADEAQIAKAIKEIEQFELVGFDTETKPTFKRGQFNYVALVQIATPEKVYILRIHQTGVTNAMVKFLENEKILKIGIAIDDDLIAMNKRKKNLKPGDLKTLIKLHLNSASKTLAHATFLPSCSMGAYPKTNKYLIGKTLYSPFRNLYMQPPMPGYAWKFIPN
ncbi:MAG: 3'-5' exonuclease domain-containing protein 2 [Cyclobacteriaceae bacterium]|nr:3'-5' exonuclease domain-containing protein 2 [Cyclobacteriaceae bacterium]